MNINIIEFAMQMEKDGRDFYLNLIQKTKDTHLETVLNMLADEELNHLKVLERIQQAGLGDLPESHILSQSKNIFQQMKDQNETLDLGAPQPSLFTQFQSPNTDQIKLYIQAQDIEQKSIDFYQQHAEQFQDNDQKQLFLKLATEERKHYILLENIIEFISRPRHWLENAEFVHLEDY